MRGYIVRNVNLHLLACSQTKSYHLHAKSRGEFVHCVRVHDTHIRYEYLLLYLHLFEYLYIYLAFDRILCWTAGLDQPLTREKTSRKNARKAHMFKLFIRAHLYV